MKLDTEFIQMPWRFDAGRLAAEVAAIPEEAWRPHPQGHPGNSALSVDVRALRTIGFPLHPPAGAGEWSVDCDV